MIKLYSRHALEHPQTGSELNFDLDGMRRDLEAAFAASGITETWMAEHILLTLAEQSHDQTPDTDDDDKSSTAATDTAVDFLVNRMLVDAGYPDVAQAFARLRNLPLPTLDLDAKPWSAARVSNLIRATMPLSESARKRLVPQVLHKLEALGFHPVGDELIRELGEHVLASLAKAERSQHEAPSGWLAAPGYWGGSFPDETGELIAANILKIFPGSDLFPAPRITVDLKRLAQHTGSGDALTELEFFPKAQVACNAAAQAVEILLHQAGDKKTDTLPPGHVIIRGVHTSVERFLYRGASKTQAKRAARDLEERIRNVLQQYASLDLIVSIWPGD